MKTIAKTLASASLWLLLLGVATPSQAYIRAAAVAPGDSAAASRFVTTQRDGMSLSQAVDLVRRDSNVERVISAETRVRGGREVHFIKVLTRDGKVRTHKIQGRPVN